MNLFSSAFLRRAYAEGYFPMPAEMGGIAWYRPDPRAILPLDRFHCSRSLAKTLRRQTFTVTYDQAFNDVMRGCAERQETWITEEFIGVYTQLHRDGFAHSVEVWLGNTLAGGVYGVSLGGAFFAESKFHKVSNASKVALYQLVETLKRSGYKLLEVQFLTSHLERLGAVEIDDENYMRLLKEALHTRVQFNHPS